MDIAVVGLGAAGTATARALANSGHRVVGFERFRVGHDRGSSHGETRVIRHAYPDPLYVALARDSWPLWEALERDAGETLLVRCPGITLGPRGDAVLAAVARALDAGGLSHESLGPAETSARFPALRLRPGEEALLHEGTGFLRAGACVRAMARLAAERGARIREETEVVAVEPHPGGTRTRLRTRSGESADFDAVVVAAGAWTGKLLPDLRAPLRVTRQVVAYFSVAGRPEDHEPDRFPVWIDVATWHYGVPRDGRIDGVKVARHVPGEPVDPDGVRRAPDPAEVAELHAYAAARIAGLGGTPVHAETCLYTNTRDEDFVVDVLPGPGRVVVVSACSGHGFKFAVRLGAIAADLATGASPRADLARFSLARLRGD